MRILSIRIGIALIAGVVAGAVAGQATIAGMARPAPLILVAASTPRPTNLYGPALYGPADYADANPDMAAYARVAAACAGCSDYDLGYRFAVSRNLHSSAECMDHSWSYQRGCLAYLREG